MRALPPALLLLSSCGLELASREPWDGVSGADTRFALPLAEPWRFPPPVTAMDHDPVSHGPDLAACVDFLGRAFPWCYDQHTGADFSLQGGLDAMDAGSSPVIAASDGVVVEVIDGNYDRCWQNGAFLQIDCDGHPMIANLVVLEHADGLRSRYAHLMNGSIEVEVGDEVQCGDRLGLVGSSGRSGGPHLHFGVQDADGLTIDPFASYDQPDASLWVDQGVIGGLPGSDCAP